MSLFQEQAYKTDTGGQTEEIDRDEIVLQSEHTHVNQLTAHAQFIIIIIIIIYLLEENTRSYKS